MIPRHSTSIRHHLLILLSLALTAYSSTTLAQEPPSSTYNSPTTEVNQTITTPSGADYIKNSGRIGVGISLSNVSYFLGAKFYLHKYLSLQLSGPMAGFGPVFGGVLISHFLFEAPPFYQGDALDLSWEIGAGPGVYYSYSAGTKSHDLTASLGFDLGLQLLFKSAPFDLVFAYQPALYWNTDLNHTAQEFWHFDPFPYGFAIAARYYF